MNDIFDEMNTTIERFFGPLTNWIRQGGKPMTEKEYNQLPAVRRSDLLLLRRSPKHLEYAKSIDGMQPPTPAMVFGSACHKYVLEGADAFNTEYAVAPAVDRRTKQGKEEWEIFKLENEGKEVITPDDFEQIRDMKRALREHPTAMTLLSGEHEQSYVWTDDETGEDCKIRLDCLTNYQGRPLIVDYKTVSSCEDGVFERECRKYGYKIQAGMYTEGLAVATNFMTDAGFAFVAQEKTPPYAVRVYTCDPGFIEQGNRQFHELLRCFHECRVTDNWPGYADGYLLANEWEEVSE